MTTHHNSDEIVSWLTKSIYKGDFDSCYQYGYIMDLRGRRVIATSTGIVAHYSWSIPLLPEFVIHDYPQFQIVDFGFGTNIEKANEWINAPDAFGSLLNVFDSVFAIQVELQDILSVAEKMHTSCEHFMQHGTAITLEYHTDFVRLSSRSKPFITEQIPTTVLAEVKEFNITVQSGLILNALSAYREGSVSVRCTAPPDTILAIGDEGDKLAIIMHMSSD